MSAACGLTIVKRFGYRGDPNEEFSNSYWLTGGAPADAAAFLALFTPIATAEKACYDSTTKIVRAYGYNDDTGHKPGDTGTVAPAAWVHDLLNPTDTSIPGTLVETDSDQRLPGDSAVWVRWKTSRVTSPGGKPIYIRKYIHPAYRTTGDNDTVLAAQKTALLALATKLDDGSLPDGRKITTAGQSDVILSHGCSTYVTTRTLKRRGRRP